MSPISKPVTGAAGLGGAQIKLSPAQLKTSQYKSIDKQQRRNM